MSLVKLNGNSFKESEAPSQYGSIVKIIHSDSGCHDTDKETVIDYMILFPCGQIIPYWLSEFTLIKRIKVGGTA